MKPDRSWRTCRIARIFGVLLYLSGTASAQATLTVNSGSLGLMTSPGATNHIWADASPTNMVFDRWVGNTNVLTDAYAWHTTAVMPTNSATVTATYKSAPTWPISTNILNGLKPSNPNAIFLVYYFPTNPAGLIFCFHGTGGSAERIFGNDNVEYYQFLRDSVAAGYAVAALDSIDRVTNKQWSGDSSSTNADVLNVKASINYFISLGLMTTNTPKYSTGMSDGGGFAPKPAYYLGFNACSIWCAAGAPLAAFNVSTVPTIWSLAQNDDLYNHTTFLQDSQTGLASLGAQHPPVLGELRENTPSPVYPRRFMRIPGFTAAYSQMIYNDLKNNGFLNAQDYLLTDPNTSGWINVLPAGFVPYQSDIEDQLDCCYTAHQFYSDYNNKVLRFLGAQHPPVTGRGGISAFNVNTNGTFHLTVAADPGQAYRVQASSNLVNWSNLFTNSNAAGTFDFSDNAATNQARRFYRTVSP